MVRESFGAAIGKLILQRRKALGLTQAQAAEDAFGSSAKVRRISELEGGLVANPHPRTLDPLIVALKITEEQVEECAKRTSATPDPALDNAYREARNLIEAIAWQFEHTNPNASLSELDEFLRARALEWSDLRKRIRDIDLADQDMAELKATAVRALDQADFDEADRTLARAEDLQLTRLTLGEVRKLAELRVSRGDVALMAGRRTEATEHYISAARYLEPFSEIEACDLLHVLAEKMYETDRRSIRPVFKSAVTLLRRVLDYSCVIFDASLSSKTYYRLSLIYRNAAMQVNGSDSLDLLHKAVESARLALLSADSIEEENDENLFHNASINIALGNALFDRARLLNQIDQIDEAISIFSRLKSKLPANSNLIELVAHVSNCFAAALMTRVSILGDKAIEPDFDEVISSYEEAVSHAERCQNYEIWGAAHANMGQALAVRADITPDIGSAAFFRLRSISALLAAIETYPSTEFPLPFAQSHLRLGKVLFRQSQFADDVVKEAYMIRAVNSYQIALAVFDEQNYPSEWTSVQAELGRIFFAHAKTAGEEIADADLDRAEEHIKNALRGYEAAESHDGVRGSKEALNTLKKERTAKK